MQLPLINITMRELKLFWRQFWSHYHWYRYLTFMVLAFTMILIGFAFDLGEFYMLNLFCCTIALDALLKYRRQDHAR